MLHFAAEPLQVELRCCTSMMNRAALPYVRRYEMIKDIGSGNFGVAKLMKDRQTGELVAIKLIERGEKIDKCALLCLAVNPAHRHC